MSTFLNIPTLSLSKPFGKVTKIIFFDVSDTFGVFTVNLFITANRDLDTTIEIFNNESKEVVFSKVYKKTALTSPLFDPQKIKHVPGFKGTIYGIRVK
jgi:hypothetical protein